MERIAEAQRQEELERLAAKAERENQLAKQKALAAARARHRR